MDNELSPKSDGRRILSERRTEISRRAADGDLKLPEAIRDLRKALGLSQEEFGSRFSLSRRQVSELETGKGNPTLRTLRRICGIFGLEVGFVPRR